MSRLFIEQDVT